MRKTRSIEGYAVDSLRNGLIGTLVAAAIAYSVQLRDPIALGLFLSLLLLPRNFGLYVFIRRMNPTVTAGLLGLALLLPIPDFLVLSGDWTMAFAHLAMLFAVWKVQHRRLTVGDAWFLFAVAFFIALLSTGGVRDSFFAPLLAFYTLVAVVMLTTMCLMLEEQRVLDLARVRGFERSDAEEVDGRRTAPRMAMIAALRHLSLWLIAGGFFIWWATPHVISGVGGAVEFVLYGDREEVVDPLPEAEDDEILFAIPDGVFALPPFGDRLERDEFVRRREQDHLALMVRPTPGSSGFARDLRLRGECYDYLTSEGRWIRSRQAETTVYDGEDGNTDGKVRLLPGMPGVASELEYLMPPGHDRTVYVSPIPVRVDVSRIVRDGTGNLRFLDSLAVPRSYVVLSSAHEPGVGSLLAEPGPEFLLLPEGLDREKIDATLEPLTAHLADPLRRVQAILTWLRKDYVRYEEDERVVGPEAVLQKAPPPVDVEGFLFERKWGRDIDFASAAIVLLRAEGIPCRLATGYGDGIWIEDPGFYIFRTGGLKAWVEVPFAGHDWVPFEPWPFAVDELPPDVVDEIFDAPEDVRADQAAAAIEEAKEPSLLRRALDAIDEFVSKLVPGGGDSTAAGRLLAWLIVLCGLVLAAWMVYRLSDRVGTVIRAQRAERRRDGPRFPFYERLLRVLSYYGYRRRPAETPLEFAHAVVNARGRELLEVIRLTNIFNAMRYGEEAVSKERSVSLIGRVAALQRQMEAGEPAPERSGRGIITLVAVLILGLLVGSVAAQEAEIDPGQAVAELAGSDPARRKVARDSLVSLGADIVPELLALFDDDRPTDRDREIRALVAGLDDPDFRVREKASSDLAALGAEAKEALLRVLADGSPEARHRARVLLNAIKSPAPSDEATKRRNLRMQQRMALGILARVGDAPEIEPIALIAELYPHHRKAAARALAAIGRRRPRDFLLLLDRPRPVMRRLAAISLGFWPPRLRRDHLLRLVGRCDLPRLLAAATPARSSSPPRGRSGRGDPAGGEARSRDAGGR